MTYHLSMQVFCSGFVSATLLAATTPALAEEIQLGFAGAYAPSNWTFSNNNADGNVNTASAPASITITGGNNSSFTFGTTDYQTTAAAPGPVSFEWYYFSGDCCDLDGFGYLLNGNFTVLANNDSQGHGSTQFNVLAGDIFGFRVYTTDNILDPGVATISNFSAPVPAPLPVLGYAITLGYCRRMRNKSHRLRIAAASKCG